MRRLNITIFLVLFSISLLGQENHNNYLKEFGLSKLYVQQDGYGTSDILNFSESGRDEDREVILLEPSLQDAVNRILLKDSAIHRCVIECRVNYDFEKKPELNLDFIYFENGKHCYKSIFNVIREEAQKIKVTVLLNRAKRDTFLFIIGYRKPTKKGDGL